MFFKRHQPVVISGADNIAALTSAGYAVSPGPSGSLAVKGGYAALLREVDGRLTIAECGLAINGQIAELTDLGYQKVFVLPGGKRLPAIADHLMGLHDFTEDLRESLGLTSLYNEGLGTTNEKHLYDRVTARDSGLQPKPWERR